MRSTQPAPNGARKLPLVVALAVMAIGTAAGAVYSLQDLPLVMYVSLLVALSAYWLASRFVRR